MDFSLTEDHVRIQAIGRKLAADFATRAAEHDRDASSPVENYAALREAGLFGLTVPKKFDGWGTGLLGYAIAAEEIARGCASTMLSFNMHAALLASLTMTEHVPDAVKRRVADLAIKDGKLIAALLSEPSSTGILPTSFACSTQARQVPGGYLLTGKKAFCTMVDASDYICVFAHPEESANPETGLAVLFSSNSPGLRIEKVWDTLGVRATRSDNLILENCFVPQEAVIGEIPSVGDWLAANEPIFNLPYTAVYLGVGFAALRAAIDSVKQRRPKGYRQPLAYHPDIRRRVALMSAELEAARWLLRYSAWLLDTEGQTPEATATYFKAKYIVGEAVIAATRSALEVGGAHAVFKTSVMERLFRDGATASIHRPNSDLCLSALSIHELQLDLKEVQPPLAPGWE